MYYFLTKSILDDFFEDSFKNEDYPKFKIKNNGDNLEIYVITPGFEKEDLNIEVNGEFLHISGKTKEKITNLDLVDKFEKKISLPKYDLDLDKTKSSYKNGILKIIFPKKEKKTFSNKITIS